MANSRKTATQSPGTPRKTSKKTGVGSAVKKRLSASIAGVYTVPPVIGKGTLTKAQVRRAVAKALEAKTFEADK